MAFYKKNLFCHCFAILLSVCLLFLFATGCGVPETVDFSYTKAPFFLTVTGEITLFQKNDASVGKIRSETPINFSATVSSDVITPPTGSNAYENAITVTYTSPESLKGLQVTCRYSQSMTGNEPVTLTYPSHPHPMTYTARYEDVKYLLLPVTSLFPQGDVTSVSPAHDGQKTVTLQSTAHPNLHITYVFSEIQKYPESLLYESDDRKIVLQFSAPSKDP